MSDQITLADIEAQIQRHQEAIAELRETGARMDEFAQLPGAEAMKWLIKRGSSDVKARALIVQIVRERRADRETENEETTS